MFFKRLYSKPKNDTFSLADALGLLSPSRHAKSSAPYKPSLLLNLQKGSVAEQFKELQSGLGLQYPVSSVNHKELFDSLVVDLQAVNALLPKSAPPKSLIGHIKSLEDEEELLELLRLSYHEKKLTLQLLSKFMLNKNLKTLSRLPFDVRNLNHSEFRQNGWSTNNFTEFKILLMKKYHDLKCPLSIVRMLKENFESEFLPLIQSQKLSPFYERIVWKFYFDFMDRAQVTNIITKLDTMRHSFLIWEASAHDSLLMSSVISKQHHYNMLQKLFVQLASWSPGQEVSSNKKGVEEQVKLDAVYSKFLSSLKAISARMKLYEIQLSDDVHSSDDIQLSDDVATRALAYSLIHKLEASVQTHYPNWKNDGFLKPYMDTLHHTRATMMQQGIQEAKAGSLVSNDMRYV